MAASALGAELTRLFESLRSSSLQKGEIAATSAANLYTLCIDRITVDTAYCSSVLFAKENGVLSFLQQAVAVDELSSCKVELLRLLSDYIKPLDSSRAVPYCLDIKNVCVSIFSRDRTSKVQSAALELLTTVLYVVAKHDSTTFDIPRLADKFFQVCLQPTKHPATVRSGVFQLLGTLCELYPAHMIKHADRLVDIYTKTLKQEMMSKKKKPEMAIVSGCLRGLSSYLINFTQSAVEGSSYAPDIYRYTCMAIEPAHHMSRYDVPRAGLSLLERHAAQFREYLVNKYEHVYESLLSWCHHPNRECSRQGFSALESFFEQVSVHITEDTAHKRVFWDLIKQFRSLMDSPDSGYRQLAVAVRGYSYFAAPCKVYGGDVLYMYNELQQRSEHMFFSSGDLQSPDDKVLHLTTFIRALGNIIAQLKQLAIDCSLLKRLVLLLFECYPHMTSSSDISSRSLLHLLSSLDQSVLQSFLSFTVYHGIILTCSHPVVIESVDDSTVVAIDSSDGGPSYASYIDLWIMIMDPTRGKACHKHIKEQVFNTFIESVMELISKLNLNRESANNESTTDQCDPNQSNADPNQSNADSNQSNADQYGSPLLQPAVPKDFQVFINIVELSRKLLAETPPVMFRGWVLRFGRWVVTMATKHPIVSGFYKLLGTCFKICTKCNYFENVDDKMADCTDDTQQAFVTFQLFTREVAVRMQQYREELQYSCLQALLALPSEIVLCELTTLVPSLQVSLTLGLSYTPLARAVVDALETWFTSVPLHRLSAHLPLLVPAICDYLHNSTAADLPATAMVLGKERRHGRRVAIKRVNQSKKSTAVCQRMVYLLGSLGGYLAQATDHHTTNTATVVWDCHNKLLFELPFPDMKPSLQLDCFLPIVCELATGSNSRQVKVAACEFLHAVILFITGKTAHPALAHKSPMAPLFRKLCPVMLLLACDADQVVEQLFRPLTFQLIHWYTRNTRYESADTVALLDSILECIEDPTNSALREFSATCIHEYLLWSIKQTSAKQQDKAPGNTKSLLKRLYSMASHPSPTKRLGAALALNSIYTVFREDKLLVDMFVLELLVVVIKSLTIASRHGDTSGCVEQYTAAVGHLIRIIRAHSITLNKHSDTRRIPRGLKEATLSCVVQWCVNGCGYSQQEARKQCMRLMTELAPLAYRLANVRAWIRRMVESDGCQYFTSRFESGGCDNGGISARPVGNTVSWLEDLQAAIDCYIMMLTNQYVSLSELFPSEGRRPQLFNSVNHFLSQFTLFVKNGGNSTARVVLVLLELVNIILTKHSSSQVATYVSEALWQGTVLYQITTDSLFNPAAVGCPPGDTACEQELVSAATNMLTVMVSSSRLLPSLQDHIVQQIGSGGPYCLIAQLPVQLTSLTDHHVQFDQTVCGHIVLMNNGLLASVLTTMGLSQCDIVCRIMESIVDPVVNPAIGNTCKLLLELAFIMTSDITELLPYILGDNTGVMVYHLDKPMVHRYIISHLDTAIVYLMQQAATKHTTVFQLLCDLLEYPGSRDIATIILSNWSLLSCWWVGKDCDTTKISAATLLNKVLSVQQHDSLQLLGSSALNMYTQFLMDPNNTLTMKSKMLDPLKYLMCSSDEIVELVKKSLEQLVADQFPLKSTEYSPGTPAYNEYITVIEKLSDVLVKSGSRVLLRLLVSIMCRENQHSAETILQSSFGSYINRDESSAAPLQLVYDMFTSAHTDTARRVLGEKVCVHMMRECNEPTLVEFCCSNISSIMATIEERIARGPALQTQLLSKLCCFQFVEVMYSRLSSDAVSSTNSTINTAYCSGRLRLTGKELTQATTKAGHAAKQEERRGDQLMTELRRQYHCHAYNMLVAIISCTQYKIQFYTTFLFKEDLTKGMLLWDNIVDTNRSYHFECELESPVQRKKMMTAIREEIQTTSAGSPQYISSLYLTDSSLSADVSMYDFSLHTTSPQPSEVEVSSYVLTEEEIEQDDLNTHECMTVIMRLLDHMQRRSITPAVRKATELPSWMAALHKKFSDSDTHTNVRLFIARIITNRPKVFQPYAEFWLPELVQLVLGDNNGLHYFTVDVIATMLSWATTAVLEDRYLANRLLQYCMRNVHHSTKAIFRNNLEIVRSIVECWNSVLQVPTKLVYELFSDTNRQTKNNRTGVQLLGVMVANNMCPYNTATAEGVEEYKFYTVLATNLLNHYKEIYAATAEVLGVCLQQLDRANNPLMDQLRAMVCEQLSLVHSQSDDRFITALHGLHYSPVSSRFVDKLLFFLPSLSGIFLTMCLEVLHSQVEIRPQLYQELKEKGLHQLLVHRDSSTQLASLQLVEGMMDRLSVEVVCELVPHVRLQPHHSVKCRLTTCNILIRAYTRLSSAQDGSQPVKQCAAAAKDQLLHGLYDDSDEIRQKVFKYWNQDANLGTGTLERLGRLLPVLYSAHTEQHFLPYCTNLLLELTSRSPDYSRMMFDQPLSECKFNDYKLLDLSWQHRHHHIMPLFAATQSVTDGGSAGESMATGMVRATQQSLAFTPTQEQGEYTWMTPTAQSMDMSSSTDTAPPSQSSTALLFSMAPPKTRPLTRTSSVDASATDEDEEQRKRVLQLKRRFLKNPSVSSKFFAKRETRKKIAREDAVRRQKAARSSHVVMYRQYREGELPDIQIKNAELIRPLQAMAQHDSVLARQLFTGLYSAVLREQRGLTEREVEELHSDVQQTMDTVLESSIHFYPPLVGSLQEICFTNQRLQLQPSSVASASTVSMQEPTGIMLLERQLLTSGEMTTTSAPKRFKGETATMSATTETWIELARLYKSLEEYDVLHGIFTNLEDTHTITHKALLAEERNDYVTASQLYKEALEKNWGSSRPLQEEEDLWDGSLLMCYSELTRWQELSNTVDMCIDDLDCVWTDPYNQERYLPHMIKARVKLCCCGMTDPKLAAFVQKSLVNESHRAVLESRYCYELCVISILQDDVSMASHYLQCCVQSFYQDWMSISKLQTKALSSRLQRLQLLTDVKDYIEYMSSDNAITKTSLTGLLQRWRNRYPHQRLDPLSVWDDVITTRCMMMRKITEKAVSSLEGVEELVSREYISLYLKIANTARTQGNYPVARRYLELTDDALRTHVATDDGCLQLQSLHSIAKLVIKNVSCDLSPSHCDKLIDLVHKLMAVDDHHILYEDSVLACTHHQLSGQALSLMADIISTPDDGLVALQSLSLTKQLMAIIGQVDTNPAMVSNKLWVRAMSSFNASIHASKTKGSPNADSLMEMASFCDRILRREDEEEYHSGLDTKQFPDTIVSYVLKAMALGSSVARQQFPHLLQLLEAYPSSCVMFVKRSGSVPCWMFLAWLGQLVALLDKNGATAVYSILETIANTYPQALCYPLKISTATLVFDDSTAEGIARKESFDKLQAAVYCPLVDEFIVALEQLNSPEQSWKDRCDNEIKPLMQCSQRDKEAIAKIWKRIYSSIFEQEAESMGQIAKRFAKTHSKKVENKFGRDATHMLSMSGTAYNAAVTDLYKKMKEGQSQCGSALLQQYSPWLANFQDTQYQTMLEIPGQYTGQNKPLPEYHIMVSSFDERVMLMASLRKPKRISIRGSDARDHLFLVKCGEDLRLDQRIEQLYEVMNAILREDPACCQRELTVHTYRVVPMTSRVGIIQWLNNTKPLKDFLESALEEVEKNSYHRKPIELHFKFIGGSTPADYMKMYRNQRITASECAKSYHKRVSYVPWNLLRRAFLKMAVSPEAFLVLRSRFVRSHATLSVCQYVLGIGDRHLSNFLINEQTGAMIGIDFGHAFGSATQLLPIPELLPFRLTPQITNLLLPHKESGQLRSCMTHALRALRHDPTLLLNTMDVFIKEPHLEWKNDALKQAEAMRKEGEQVDNEDSSWYPRERVALAHKKLQGHGSRQLMLEDLYNGHHSKPEYAAIKRVLLGKEEKQLSRSVEDQVAGLISHATDTNILARTYQGWHSWV